MLRINEVRCLGIQEAEKFLFVVLAERRPDAHVPHHRTRNARRKTIRSCMAAGAILLEDALAFILMRCAFRCHCLFRVGFYVCLLRGLRVRPRLWRCHQRYKGSAQEKETGEGTFQAHLDLPFQAGKRNR